MSTDGLYTYSPAGPTLLAVHIEKKESIRKREREDIKEENHVTSQTGWIVDDGRSVRYVHQNVAHKQTRILISKYIYIHVMADEATDWIKYPSFFRA